MKDINTDICIIGGGAAGLSLASGAIQMGANVVLFEKGKMGGDCLNYGCIPSKTLLANAKTAFLMKKLCMQNMPKSKKSLLDFKDVKKNISGVIDRISPHDSKERFEKLGVKVINEHARFTGRRQISSHLSQVNYKYAVIATGTKPFIPKIPGLSKLPYFTNETIFSLSDLPSHLIIIGGGAIGIELAQAFIRLGSQVSIIECKSVLANYDPEFSDLIKERLMSEGIKFYEETLINNLESKNNKIFVQTKKDKTITGSHLLVSAGRITNTKELDLEKAGIETKNTLINTNQFLQTKNKYVYAIGDVVTTNRHTNVASAHASVVLKNILFKFPSKINTKIIPSTIYIEPELSQIGYTKQAAEKEFGSNNIICVKHNFMTNDRNITDGNLDGLIHLVAKKNGVLLGATIFGPNAGELIQVCTFAITQKLKLKALATLNFPYPSYGEAIKYAASSLYTQKIFGDKMRWLVNLRFKLFP